VFEVGTLVRRFKSMVIWPYGLVFLSIALFYFEILTVKGAWLVGDHSEQHYPWAVFLADQLKQGMLPFWTNLIHAGFPLIAEGQIGAFYLPNIIFYRFLPIEYGYAWNIIFHLLLSGFFMLRYLKSIGIEDRSAVFGTLVYLFGSTLGGAYYNITSLKVLTWFPLTLLLADQVIREAKFQVSKIVGLGFIFSLQLVAGYLQFAAYAILFTSLYLFFRLFDLKRRDIRLFVVSFGNLALAVLLAALISFPQLYLTYELAVLSNRANPEESFAYIGSYSPFAFVCLLFPTIRL